MSPATRLKQTQARTQLAAWRVKRGMTQMEMVRATGITRTSYLALEHGEVANPKLRYLVNCAVVLGCGLGDLIEPEWREWMVFDASTAPGPPPDPRELWKPN